MPAQRDVLATESGWGMLERYVDILMGYLPSHPHAHIRLASFDNGKGKRCPVVRRTATVDDYTAHLAPDAYGGIGALGVYPSLPGEPLPKGGHRWHSSFIALDFDKHKPLELVGLTDALLERGALSRASCGTSGRGSHLYLLLSDPIPTIKAYEIAQNIADLAKNHKLAVPECFPSHPCKRGNAILLPYRGALHDGYGFNPLLDPTNDFMPIRLEALAFG